MTVNSYPDLFFGYLIVWICLFSAVVMFMVRGWRLERRLKELTQQLESGKKLS